MLVVGLQDLLDVEATLGYGLEVAQDTLLAVFDHQDVLLVHQELELVRDEHNELVLEEAFDAFIENVVGDLRVNCAQRVVQQIDVGLRVDCSGQADSGLLSSGNVDASLADDGVGAFAKVFDVFFELRGVNGDVE